MSIYAEAKHGIVCSVDEGKEKYFGWPSVAKLADGTIVTGASGLRRGHVCPWGRSVVAYSKDGGETYGDFRADNFLIEEKALGCNASFLRVEREDLPADAQALLPEEADSSQPFTSSLFLSAAFCSASGSHSPSGSASV